MSTPPRRTVGTLAAITALIVALPPAPASSAQTLGRISGSFAGSAGPLSNVGVLAKSLTNPANSVVASTRADGRFTLQARPGVYKVRFRPPGTLDQWATGRESEWLAEIVTVDAGAEAFLAEKALPTGRMQGRLADSAGRPVPFAGVVAENPGLARFFQATTDAQGGWFLTAWPGSYRVRFHTTTQAQWATGTVVVTEGKTTPVDETLAVPGELAVSAVDAHTGIAVLSFCVDAHNPHTFVFACTEDGVAEFGELGPGSYAVKVSDGVHLDSSTKGVEVASAQAATLTASMHPGATIAVRVTDAVTGTPVPGVCVTGQPANRAPEYGEFLGDCTDSSGTVTLARVVPDDYVFFAAAFDEEHGSQWVGPQGGVGAQAAARVVVARDGATTGLDVRLDGRGGITGVIVDAETGLPVENAEATVGQVGVVSGSDGRYEFGGLGPYEWVVTYGEQSYARQWSGGGGNRYAATPIPVRLGETTEHDVALRKGATLRARITGAAGQPPDWAEITVVNAKTFDTMYHALAGSDGVAIARLTGPQEVKLLVLGSVGGVTVAHWYPAAELFSQGDAVSVPMAGTTEIEIQVRVDDDRQ